MRALVLESACWSFGLGLIGFYGLARADAALNGRLDLARFEQSLTPDASLWSPARLQAWRVSSRTSTGDLLGALRIQSLGLEAPLYADTDELHLNRGVGVIDRTAWPGAGGNLGIAGHRDGFFRALEDIRVGDTVEVLTVDRSYRYRIVRISIVDRTDATLLQPTGQPVVTLVTCHPFYFIGHAPRRFIVRGVLEFTGGRES